MIDTAQDHSGHFCFHQSMMRNQLECNVHSAWNVARTMEMARQVTYVPGTLGLSLMLPFFFSLCNLYRVELTCFLLIVHCNSGM